MLPALLLLLLASLPLAAQSTQNDKCVVTGHVTNSLTGEPIKKAAVHLRPVNMKPGPGTVQGYISASEADGRFEFDAIPAGDYMLMGDHSGFQFRGGTKVTLRPGQQITDLTLKLTPQAVISGKVVDEDGDPVGSGNVQVVRQTWQHGKLTYTMAGGSGVNDLGEFRVSKLSAGKYYVFAQSFTNSGMNELPGIPGKPDLRQVRTFYPDATAIDAAAAVQVGPGQDSTGIDIRLRTMQTYHVRGRVAGNVTKSQAQRIMLNLLPRGLGTMMPGAFANVGADLSFDLSGVAPGSYWLNAFSAGRGNLRGSARQAVDVGAGDLNDVVVNIVPPGSLHGTVRVEGTPPAGSAAPSLTGIRVWMMAEEQGPMMGSGQGMTGEDGTFDIENMAPGRYYPQIAGHIQGAYLKAVRLGQQDVLGQELDFSQGVSGELEIVFRYGAAEVDGTVQLPQNQNADMESARVVLIPDTLNADGSGIESSSLNQNGQFSVKQLRPGHYRAYAFEKIDGNVLENPDVVKLLSNSGTDVDLNENDRKQIQLPLISADDTTQLLARAGVEMQ